ncbi:MATE family efflux transporter [Solimicrobium silvestre]|uniref:Multidrug-efflux transporter n=1 Tax=Solimicrobium silvestre TaxID=2099400 RepID=A0A2S9GWB1_9BURK|nr:MATE family efflux transporter [Solimicrobium silvestre]PRC92000.1 matE: MATE efflux family protein [Solimicrobium silvestre]
MIKDLTQGSIRRHLITMSIPIGIGMFVQTLYFMVDLYFVGRLGDAALAGVSAAGTIMYIVMALTQMLGVGTVALMARAIGAHDKVDSNLIFNQSLLMSGLCAVVILFTGLVLTPYYFHALGADPQTTEMGVSYLRWYAPGLALQFILNAIGSALRAGGIVKPGMLVQIVTVLINIVLAPVLIAGWGTGYPLGVMGAGLASSIAIAIGVVMLFVYFVKQERFVRFQRNQMHPQWGVWRRILNIGFPAGAEFACFFVFMAVIYSIISHFGPAAMAGFGVGSRLMQAIFLPGMAIAFAVPAIAGQNMGAKAMGRVKETMRQAIYLEVGVMVFLTLVCKFQPSWLVGTFARDPQSALVAAEFLHIISWNFVATGLIFVCSGFFQALGNTWPSLLSTGTRLFLFAVPAYWLSLRPEFTLHQLWYLSVATVACQAVMSLCLLRWQWKKSMAGVASGSAAAAAESGNSVGLNLSAD